MVRNSEQNLIVFQKEPNDPEKGLPVRVYNLNRFLIESGFLKAGKRHGEWITYRDRVLDTDSWLLLRKKVRYENGKKEGIAVAYYKDQSQRGLALYRDDKLIAGDGCAREFYE